MSKFLQILLIATIAVALCHADGPRYRTARLRNRFSARQAVETDAVTPYPTANELKPEVPFEEVENSAAAAEEPNQPDQTYGPPEVEIVDESRIPVEEVAEEDIAAENDVAPAGAEEPILVTVEEEEPVATDELPQAERLVFGRRTRGGRFIAARPAKLRAVPVVRTARLQQRQQQRFFVANAPFVYAAQAQGW